jgi:tetratricopeptide (TPR) repeat protein
MGNVNKSDRKYSSGPAGLRAVIMPLLVLTAATLLAFANASPNSLVLDDKAFAGPERPPVLDSVQYIFTHDVWSSQGIDSGLYRPLLLLGLSFESWLFGGWLKGYHLSNILQHLLVSLLTFGFLRHVLNMNRGQTDSSNLYALLAALVFAVHPIHTEAVDSIFNRSEIMVALFGIAGLWWLLHYLNTRPARAWTGLAVAYLLALLSKESAITIPGLAVALILLLSTDSLTTRIRKCLPVFWLLLPLACYLALRAYALDQPGIDTVGPASTGAEIASELDRVRIPSLHDLFFAAGIFGKSMKVMVWPYPLNLYYQGLSTSGAAYYLAMQLVLIIAALALLARKRQGLACGLAFFYVAMLPASLIFDAAGGGTHLAERYLYFPSIGLVITLAFVLRTLARRFGARIVVNFALPVLVLLTFLTWDRNADWASDLKLFETEYQKGYRGSNVLRILANTHLLAKNYARVVKICDENRGNEKLPNNANPYWVYCAIAYEHQNRIKEAEEAYLLQIGAPRIRIEASLALAHFYIRQKRRYDAEKHFLDAVNWSEDPADKALYMGEMIISLNPALRDQAVMARDYVREALRLRPGWRKAEIMLEGLDRVLNSPVEGTESNGSQTPPQRTDSPDPRLDRAGN